MARNSKIVLDLEFGDIDEAMVKAMGKKIGDTLRKTPIDMNWKEVENSITKVRADIKKTDDELTKSSDKLKGIEKQKVGIQEKLNQLKEANSNASKSTIDVEKKYAKSL